MNLQNLNLVELNAQEVQEVEGGIIPILFIAMILFSPLATHKLY
jgi:lactobin A/cerein 7B family class IIb bacteriocin